MNPSSMTTSQSQKERSKSQPLGKGSGPGQWSTNDRERLLEWLGRNLQNYEAFKTDKNRVVERISKEVYCGVRSGSSVKSQWEAIKKKYRIAQAKLHSTGEGQRYDQDLWSSIRTNWLDKLCPYYEAIDDILQRDKSFTPFYVSESGGPAQPYLEASTESHQRQFISSQFSDAIEEESEDERNEVQRRVVNLVEESGKEDFDDVNIVETEHPPAGGSKDPRKRGGTSGSGKKAIKKRKVSSEEEVFQTVQRERLAFEREHLSMRFSEMKLSGSSQKGEKKIGMRKS